MSQRYFVRRRHASASTVAERDGAVGVRWFRVHDAADQYRNHAEAQIRELRGERNAEKARADLNLA